MKNIFKSFIEFINDEEGVTAIEYALIATLVAIAIIAGAGTLGTKINTAFTFISTKINNV